MNPLDVTPLISTQDLAQFLGQQTLRVIDCRFDLQNPAWGRNNYLEGHIPGALYADLNKDLSSAVTPTTGRHPLPDPAVFVNTVAHWGITPQTRVVVCDTVGGGFAGRLWFLLKAIGHFNVQLLDGGYAKWIAEKRPIRSGEEVAIPASISYPAKYESTLFASEEEVLRATHDPDQILIDARAPERYNGSQELIDPVAGHIPGAHNRFSGLNLSVDGTFKSPDQLRQEFKDLLQDQSPTVAIAYCGSGVTACLNLFAMQVAGIPGARLYAGSWSQWIRDPSHPIAKGDQP